MRSFEAAARINQLAGMVRSEREALEALRAQTDQQLGALQEQIGAVALELARIWLPVLDEERVKDAQRRTGYRGFSRRDPFKAMEKERVHLQHTVARIEADPRYVERERLAGPMGRLVRRVAECREMLEPWEQECRRFEALEGFAELVEIGYDTPEFTGRWWQPAYWRQWAAGDRICRELGLDDFGDDVLPAWQKVEEPRGQWRGELARAEKELETVRSLVQSRDQGVQRLMDLEQIYYEECCQQLANHVQTADVGLLSQWNGVGAGAGGEAGGEADRGVEIGLKKLSALTAKREYLEDALRQGLPPVIQSLKEREAKMAQKAQKLLRPKKYNMIVPVPEPGLEQKLAGMAARRQKFSTSTGRVLRYDDYDRWQTPPQTAGWWVVFLGDSAPHPWAPGVCAWHSQHSGDWPDASHHGHGHSDSREGAEDDAHGADGFSAAGDLS